MSSHKENCFRFELSEVRVSVKSKHYYALLGALIMSTEGLSVMSVLKCPYAWSFVFVCVRDIIIRSCS